MTALTSENWVTVPKFEEYKERFKEFFEMKREDGIIEVKMHTDHGPAIYSFQFHNALMELWSAIGHDKENECLIFTGTGDLWLGIFDTEAFNNFSKTGRDSKFNAEIYDTIKIVENFINEIEIPSIVAFNGPGVHWEMGMFSDLAICTPNYKMRDDHYPNAVPGDGMYLMMQEILGYHKANYFTLFNQELSAQECLELGIVNEVVEPDKLLDRAWELARGIMRANRTTRRMTHLVLAEKYKRLVREYLSMQVFAEMYNKVATAHLENFSKEHVKQYVKDEEK